jgi:hypothetical protein
MKNEFVTQMANHILFSYVAFDRVICRGYIRSLFFAGAIILLMRNLVVS